MTKLYNMLVKHWTNKDTHIEDYWENQDLILRSKILAEVCEKYEPNSIYEVGMYNGRNLKFMHDLMPDVKLGGCEINNTAVEFAKEHVPYVDIDHLDVLSIETDKKYDIVFTHGVIMHIAPDSFSQVIDKCLEKANKYVIHLERPEKDHLVYQGPRGFTDGAISNELRWGPDIVKLYVHRGHSIIENKKGLFGSKKKRSRLVVIEKL